MTIPAPPLPQFYNNSSDGPITVTTSTTSTPNNEYIVNGSGLVVITLPVAPTVGDSIGVVGYSSSGWKIAQNASQIVNFGILSTTSGTGGYLASTNRYDAVSIMCVDVNTFVVYSSVGNITVN